MENKTNICNLCPRDCGRDRSVTVGYCTEGDKLRVGRAALHMWEEPCISGKEGSGTVFFSGCHLKCVYCQNHDLAHSRAGVEITTERLAEIFSELQSQGANNINLVTPTHFTDKIIETIRTARAHGMDLPILWNCGGYEKVSTVRMLRGYADIFLPDFKYMSSEIANKYSNAPDYAPIAKQAIDEMVKIAPEPVFDERGIMMRGVIVRHLVLPGCYHDSEKIIEYLYSTYGDSIYISIMSQYVPVDCASLPRELRRKTTQYEYDKVVDHALKIGVKQAYIQSGEAAEESFIPAFDGTGVYPSKADPR